MPQAALRELLALGGLQGEAQITGADPVLRTPFRVGAAGAAALGAVGLAAAELWHQRTGRRQQVAVDLRAAAAALKSGAYLR
ncbi:MAG TPA: CoA transferase, partial [Burkholderiales bacterium]